MFDLDQLLKSVGHEVESRINGVRSDIERAVKIALLREGVESGLSRLATLDADHAAQYQAAMEALRS